MPVDRTQRIASQVLSRIVDPFIVGSFDRTGYRVHALGFDPDDLDVDLSGRRCPVTGANSGIGFATAAAFAQRGADVVLLCRDPGRGEAARDRIAAMPGVDADRISLELVDMSDLASVQAAALRVGEAPVDVLVHNAGVLPDAPMQTPQGLELTFATHVAGPFLLTELLVDALSQRSGARVVWVSSGGMYTQRLQLADPQWRARDYDGVRAYAETKRAQVVLAQLWAEALAGHGIDVFAMHPGWADTPAVASSLPGFHRVMERVLRTPEEGADTVVWLSIAPEARVESGRFYFDRVARNEHLLPWTRETAEDRDRLWWLCKRACDDFRRTPGEASSSLGDDASRVADGAAAP